jgi:cytochrome c biogenesis protein CcdA
VIATAAVPMLLLLAGPRPYLTSFSFVLGVVISYTLCGFLIVLGADVLLDQFAPVIERIMKNPNTLEILIQIASGIVLLAFGVKLADVRPRRQGRREVEPGVGPAGAFGFGALFTLSGIWGALPYFAALDRILRADVSDFNGILLVVFYNFMFVVPLVALIIIRMAMGSRADRIFQVLVDWLGRWGRRLGVAVLILLGGILVADGIGWLLGNNILPV